MGHGRGTLGVRNMQLERDAVIIESRAVSDNDEIIAMTASGVVIRTPVSEFRVIGRGTKGVRVMRLDEKDKIVGIAFVPADLENGNGSETDAAEPDKERYLILSFFPWIRKTGVVKGVAPFLP